jgi:hypothetical protein
MKAGAPRVWRCEESVDCQLQYVSRIGFQGLRVSVALAAEHPEEVPRASAMLRDCRIDGSIRCRVSRPCCCTRAWGSP